MFDLSLGQGLGGYSYGMSFGLGLFGLGVTVGFYATPGRAAAGGGQRTYLFIPQTIRFNVMFKGTVYESHFSIPKTVGRVLAKRVPLLVKAKGETDGFG